MTSNSTHPFDLKGRTAVITGGANGIGRATALVLAAHGARVVVSDVDRSSAAAVATEIKHAGHEAVAIPADVSSAEDVENLIRQAIAAFGRVDILCNSAGIYARSGNLIDMDENEIDRVFGVNLKGTIYCCQAAIKAMERSGGGTIVNIASSIIDGASGGHSLYGITKAGVAMLTRVLAAEVGAMGIRVNAIAPGATVTDFTRHNALDDAGNFDPALYETFLATVRGRSPLGLVGEPEDQAYLILYLVSDEARFATGNIFRVNGGGQRPW